MAEWSGFFDAHKVGDSWDRTYLAEDFAKFFAPLIGNGIFAGKSNELQVFQDVPASMSVILSSGQSWIEGYGYVNDSDLKIPVDPADGALGRIDRIVNQWSSVDRRIRTVWKKGTPAVNPVAPPLRWDADYKELNICILDVSAGLSAITQDKIRDTRTDSSICGWVTGLIDQVDTSTLFAQWESAYEKEFTEQKRAWEDFFKDIQLDLGIPVPSPDKAEHVLAVDSNGGYTLSNEYISREYADNQYASKEYADSRNPYNYLDNSDFTNPVNQRGKTTYGDKQYTIDRWLLYGDGSASVTVQNGYVNVVDSSLYQRLENCKANTVYTFAVKYVGEEPRLISGTFEDGVNDGHIELRLNANSIPMVCIAPGNIEWAALYEGEYTAETLPKYHPKGYTTELRECRRYLRPLFNRNTYEYVYPGQAYKSTDAMITIPLDVPMRVTPSIEREGALSEFGCTNSTMTIQALQGIELNRNIGTAIVLHVTTANLVPGNATFLCSKISGNNMFLNAEL